MIDELGELERPFLDPQDQYDLSPFNICLKDYHYLFIGRYLAQLHCSGMLMRDVSPANIMFRMSDGYPVLIDDPIFNAWGDKAGVYSADLLVPALTTGKARFSAFCLGYFEAMQRLYTGSESDIVNAIITRIGGEFTGVPNVDPMKELVPLVRTALGHDSYAPTRMQRFTARDISLTSIVLQFYGMSATLLDTRLRPLKALVPPRSDRDPGQEEKLLKRFGAICRKRGLLPGDELDFSSNAGLQAFQELFGEGNGNDWSKDFSTFWIHILCVIALCLDELDEPISINAAQLAYVVMQYADLSISERYATLHYIRCTVARTSWYWRPVDGNVSFLSSLGFRNTENISIAKAVDQIQQTPTATQPPPLHLVFDLVEGSRNLLGNLVHMDRAAPEHRIQNAEFARYTAPPTILRLAKTSYDLIEYFRTRQDVCFFYGWRLKDLDSPSNLDLKNKFSSEQQAPVGMRDFLWATSMIDEVRPGEKFEFGRFVDRNRWLGDLWGHGWHTPFDRLGEFGFRPVLGQKSEDSEGESNTILRAGCGMIVFHRGIQDGHLIYQTQELLWPIPNERHISYQGDDARP